MRWIWTALAGLCASAPAFGQGADVLRRIERQLEANRDIRLGSVGELTTAERLLLDFGGYVTVSGLAVDDEPGSTRVLREYDGKFWAHAVYGGHEAYARLRVRFQDFNTGDSFDGGADGLVQPIGDRYWYRFDMDRERAAEGSPGSRWNFWAQAGRQDILWASGLTLNQVLYAIQAGVEAGSFAVTLLGGITPRTTTVDIDASRPQFDTDTDRRFLGVMAECRALNRHTPYIFFLDQSDENNTVLPPGVLFGYDSSYLGIGSRGEITGQLGYLAEFVKEWGTATSDPFRTFPQVTDDVDAWAARLAFFFAPRALRHRGARFELEILLASGDDDRFHSTQTFGGNLGGTDDRGFNAFGGANTGLALAPELSNLMILRLGGTATPFQRHRILQRLRVGIDILFLNKMDSDAPISVFTMPGEGFLGTEVDLLLDWEVLSDVYVEMRYGIFLPGKSGVFPEIDPRHFFYLGVSYGF
ncbi:MAG: alginate export family protein [Planctomycetaceae bacterium]